MLELIYPKRQNISQSNKLFELYGEAVGSTDPNIRFDLSQTTSLTPFGILALSVTILKCLKLNKACEYRKPKNRKLQNLLKKIGFDNIFGFSDNFVPKDIITSGIVQLKKLHGLDPFCIDSIMEILIYHLKISPGVQGSLRMSLIELMQNVVDHSGGRDYYVCAGLYPKLRQLKLCIADMGVGILSSLNKSAKYMHLMNHHEAIHLSTKLGVTSKAKTAGLGLHHIKSFLSVNKGQMCIISGKGKVFWKFDRGEIKNQQTKHPFSGTIIKLLVNTSKDCGYKLSSEEEFIF